MPRAEEYQIQFDQNYDGAYRYLDRCGEFMAKARDALGFTTVSATPTGCSMEIPEQGLQLKASIDFLQLACNQPEYSDGLIKAAEFCSEQVVKLFEPRLIVQNQIVSRSIWRTKTLEESYKLSLGILEETSLGHFGDILQMTPVNQECFYSFQSGSRRAHVRLQPISINILVAERKLPLPGVSKAYADYLWNKEKSLQTNPPRPTYGLGLEVTIIEAEPALEGAIQTLFSSLSAYRKQILDDLKI